MMVLSTLAVLLITACVVKGKKEHVVDPDFDEFEFDFDYNEDEDELIEDAEPYDVISDEDDEDLTVEEELDEEEFEDGSDESRSNNNIADNLEILESTVKIKPPWEAYFIEICVGLGILLYLTNYIMGRIRNTQIAESWMVANMHILQHNFAVVGDDGEGEEPSDSHVVRRTDNSFTVWSSGRINCKGLLVHLELMKRHDLLSLLVGLFKPSVDTVSFIFTLADNEMDSIVLAITQRKAATKYQKDYEDLSNLCNIRSADKHSLPSSLSVLSESFEGANCVLTGYIAGFINNYCNELVSLHISDQYTGLKDEAADDSETVVIKKAEKRIHVTFKLPSKIEESVALLEFAIRLLDHTKGVRLSREAKEKSQKNRARVAQSREKLQHQQRQEAAQQRKEEKKKAEKEKMLTETDPDKTRKWEEKEHKKQVKKMNNPRMKQMKVRVQ